jgi:hypothetical protein
MCFFIKITDIQVLNRMLVVNFSFLIRKNLFFINVKS